MNESAQEINLQAVGEVIKEAKAIARQYYDLTGRLLGITGEVAEYEASHLLGLSLSAVRNPGYDATAIKDGKVCRYQIKGRCVTEKANPGQRMGRIKFDYEWDTVLLVLLDKYFEPVEIFEAQRADKEL
jgi:hypothetical protein